MNCREFVEFLKRSEMLDREQLDMTHRATAVPGVVATLRRELRRGLYALMQRDLPAFLEGMQRMQMIVPGAEDGVRRALAWGLRLLTIQAPERM